MSSDKNVLLIIFLFIVSVAGIHAQGSVAEVKHKKCLLKGKWQLVQTFTDSALHKVQKEEYDAVLCFKPFHQYTEDVRYEGYHWMIKGKWCVYRRKATLALTERQYVFGKLGDVPQDILFELSELSKNNWTVNTTAEGKPVKMFYRKLPKR